MINSVCVFSVCALSVCLLFVLGSYFGVNSVSDHEKLRKFPHLFFTDGDSILEVYHHLLTVKLLQ